MRDGMRLNRRYFFLGVLGLAASCSRLRVSQDGRPQRTARVSILRAASYESNLSDLLGRVLDEHRLDVRGKRVLLKPNLVEFNAQRPINTHPAFVRAAAEAFERRGAREVLIAEGPGHRRTTLDLASAAGYFAAIPNFEQRFTDLNLDEVSRVRLNRPFSTLQELYLPQTVLGADLLVSLPKMKTHHWAGATLSMKNLFGVVPGGVYGWPKNVLHWAGIDESIADLHTLFPRQFCLVDGIEAMEGNGPILGKRKQMGVVVAGAHPPSVDATCCRLMNIDPEKIRYLTLARQGRSAVSSIEQIGEQVPGLRSTFALPPGLDGLRLEA